MTTTGWNKWVLAVLASCAFICGPGPAGAISTCRPADPDCDPHLPPPPPPPPPPPTSTPDLSMQIVPCPDASQSQFMVDRIKADVSRALRRLDLHHDDPAPNPDVRTGCNGNRGRIATWFQPVGAYGATDTAAARDRGLAQIALLQGLEQFAAHVSATGLQHLIDVAWRDVAKRMNDSGNPDPNGNVHLTSI